MQDIKKQQPHFPTAKVKKIIQQNQQIGKLSNLIPPLIQKSLQIFLSQLLAKTCEIAVQYDCNKLTSNALKKALEEMDKYDLMKGSMDDVEDLPQKKEGKRSAPCNAVQPKRGRKKRVVDEKRQVNDLSE